MEELVELTEDFFGSVDKIVTVGESIARAFSYVQEEINSGKTTAASSTKRFEIFRLYISGFVTGLFVNILLSYL